MVTSHPAPISKDFTSLLPVRTVPAATLAVPHSPPPAVGDAGPVVESLWAGVDAVVVAVSGAVAAGVLADDEDGAAAPVAAEFDDEHAAVTRPAAQTTNAKRERWSTTFIRPPEGAAGGPP